MNFGDSIYIIFIIIITSNKFKYYLNILIKDLFTLSKLNNTPKS